MARLDTGWHAHPRIVGLGLAAMGLHAWSISYCDAKLTDGFIPLGAWPSLPGITPAVHKLERSGLWVACDGGYRLHDYLDYNRSRARVTEIMAARRVAGHAGGQAKSKQIAKQLAKQNGQHTTKQNGRHGAKQNAPPRIPELINAAAAAVTPEGGSGETNGPGFRSLGSLLGDQQRRQRQSQNSLEDELPDEVRQRLSQPPITEARTAC